MLKFIRIFVSSNYVPAGTTAQHFPFLRFDQWD